MASKNQKDQLRRAAAEARSAREQSPNGEYVGRNPETGLSLIRTTDGSLIPVRLEGNAQPFQGESIFTIQTEAVGYAIGRSIEPQPQLPVFDVAIPPEIRLALILQKEEVPATYNIIYQVPILTFGSWNATATDGSPITFSGGSGVSITGADPLVDGPTYTTSGVSNPFSPPITYNINIIHTPFPGTSVATGITYSVSGSFTMSPDDSPGLNTLVEFGGNSQTLSGAGGAFALTATSADSNQLEITASRTANNALPLPTFSLTYTITPTPAAVVGDHSYCYGGDRPVVEIYTIPNSEDLNDVELYMSSSSEDRYTFIRLNDDASYFEIDETSVTETTYTSPQVIITDPLDWKSTLATFGTPATDPNVCFEANKSNNSANIQSSIRYTIDINQDISGTPLVDRLLAGEVVNDVEVTQETVTPNGTCTIGTATTLTVDEVQAIATGSELENLSIVAAIPYTI